LGVVPTDCKNGAMGNRNIYHYCIAIIIIMDILVPLAFFGLVAYTFDVNAGSVFNKTLFAPSVAAAAPLPHLYTRQANACCSLGVAVSTSLVSAVLFVLFITIPSVLEPGVMARSWDMTFCNGYVSASQARSFESRLLIAILMSQWKLDPKYQISGHVSSSCCYDRLKNNCFFKYLLFVADPRD
jgi:hypothetical protein